jgi:hypothetical protein
MRQMEPPRCRCGLNSAIARDPETVTAGFWYLRWEEPGRVQGLVLGFWESALSESTLHL